MREMRNGQAGIRDNDEWCAIAGWTYHCGLVRMDVWLKRRGEDAITKVRELIDMRWNEIRVDTDSDGVFVIATHGLEFLTWCRMKRRT